MSEQRTWCLSTSESAPRKRVHELAGDVKAFVDGKAGTEVEVDGSAGVLDVVEALKRLKVPNVTATGRGTDNRKGTRLDVWVVVRVSPREGPKEVATFSGSVDVVPTRRVVVPAVTEIGGLSFVDMGAQRWTAQNVDVVKYNDASVIPQVTDTVKYEEALCAEREGGGGGVWLYLEYNSGFYEIGTTNRLYTMGVRGQISPAGWRMPTEADWMALIAFVQAELRKSGKVGTDAEVWAKLRDGEFKAVMAGYMNGQSIVFDAIYDPDTGRARTTSTAWMVAEGGAGEAGRGGDRDIRGGEGGL